MKVLAAIGAAAALSVALLTAAAAGAVTRTKTKTIRLKAYVISDATPYTIDGSAHCAGKSILIVDLPSDVISDQASVDQPGVGPFDFSGSPFTNPITGFSNPYPVPQGQGRRQDPDRRQARDYAGGLPGRERSVLQSDRFCRPRAADDAEARQHSPGGNAGQPDRQQALR
jgi:hypothetical protein